MQNGAPSAHGAALPQVWQTAYAFGSLLPQTPFVHPRPAQQSASCAQAKPIERHVHVSP
jgi:hypothetical protein